MLLQLPTGCFLHFSISKVARGGGAVHTGTTAATSGACDVTATALWRLAVLYVRVTFW